MSWFWTTRLPEAILRLAPSVGVHPSLLPRHRGPDPCFWAIDAGRRGHRRDGASPRARVRHGRRSSRSASSPSTRPGTAGCWRARSTVRASPCCARSCAPTPSGRPPAPIPQDEGAATAAPLADRGRAGDRLVVAGRAHRAAGARRGPLAGRVDGDRRPHRRRWCACEPTQRLPARARAGRGGRAGRRRRRRPRRRRRGRAPRRARRARTTRPLGGATSLDLVRDRRKGAVSTSPFPIARGARLRFESGTRR